MRTIGRANEGANEHRLRPCSPYVLSDFSQKTHASGPVGRPAALVALRRAGPAAVVAAGGPAPARRGAVHRGDGDAPGLPLGPDARAARRAVVAPRPAGPRLLRGG